MTLRGPLTAAALVVAALAVAHFAPRGSGDPARVVVDAATRHQTILGWEATAQLGQTEIPHFVHYAAEVLDRAAGELGIDRVRLEVRGGAENPRDAFGEALAGRIDFAAWRERRYEIVNDDDDARTLRREGFGFTELDQTVDVVVNPLRERLERAGESLYVSLCYVDFAGSPFEHYDHPDEYAEFVLAVFLHLRDRYGWVPDAVEVILEPDLAEGWPARSIGAAVAAAGRRLAEAGFRPDFVAPSTKSMGNAVPYLEEALAVPGAAEFVTDLSYHRYRGATHETLRGLAETARELGLRTAHLEKIGATAQALFDDLTIGNCSTWSQYGLAWVRSDGSDDGGKYYVVDDRDPERPTVHEGARTRYLRQVFRHVRRGAVRVEATSDRRTVQPAAFERPEGGFVLCVFSRDGSAFRVAGLGPGTYAVSYATEDEPDGSQPDLVIAAGDEPIVAIPAPGVITLRAR